MRIDTTNFHKISLIKKLYVLVGPARGVEGSGGSSCLVVISFQNACVCQSTVSAGSQQGEAVQRLESVGE